MQQKEVIEPEVIRETKSITDKPESKNFFKINLTKNDNRKHYDTRYHYETHNTTINNKRGGFLYFIVSLIILPVKIIYWSFVWLNKKFHLRETYLIKKAEEKGRRKILNAIKTRYKSQNNLYDEIL